MLKVSKYLCTEFTILSFRNIDSTWQDFWLLLMVLWKRALTMTVSEKWEHFVSKNLLCGVCFHVTKKYVLCQLDSVNLQALLWLDRLANQHSSYLKICIYQYSLILWS